MTSLESKREATPLKINENVFARLGGHLGSAGKSSHLLSQRCFLQPEIVIRFSGLLPWLLGTLSEECNYEI